MAVLLVDLETARDNLILAIASGVREVVDQFRSRVMYQDAEQMRKVLFDLETRIAHMQNPPVASFRPTTSKGL